jgi:hypothetical protein
MMPFLTELRRAMRALAINITLLAELNFLAQQNLEQIRIERMETKFQTPRRREMTKKKPRRLGVDNAFPDIHI